MKKIFLLLLLSSMFFTACEKEEVDGPQELSEVLVTVDLSLVEEEITEWPEVEWYFVASNEKGNVLGSAKFDQNTEENVFTIKSPQDFKQQRVLFSMVYRDKEDNDLDIHSFVLERGALWKPDIYEEEEERESIGEVQINLNGPKVDPYSRIGVFSSGLSWNHSLSFDNINTMDIYDEPVDLYFLHLKNSYPYPEFFSFQVRKGLSAGDIVELDTDNFSENFDEYSIALDEVEHLRISAYADIAGNETYYLPLHRLNTGNSGSYRFPADLNVGNYRFEIEYYKGSKEFKSSLTSQTPDFEYQELEIQVSTNKVSNRGASFSFTPSAADFYVASWDNFDNEELEEGEIGWYLILPVEYTDVNLFEIPEVIEGYNIEWQDRLEYEGITLADFGSFDGYASVPEIFMEDMSGEGFEEELNTRIVGMPAETEQGNGNARKKMIRNSPLIKMFYPKQ